MDGPPQKTTRSRRSAPRPLAQSKHAWTCRQPHPLVPARPVVIPAARPRSDRIAEAFRERHLLLFGKGLVRKHQHQMLEPGVSNGRYSLSGQRQCEIEALNFRAQCR